MASIRFEAVFRAGSPRVLLEKPAEEPFRYMQPIAVIERHGESSVRPLVVMRELRVGDRNVFAVPGPVSLDAFAPTSFGTTLQIDGEPGHVLRVALELTDELAGDDRITVALTFKLWHD